MLPLFSLEVLMELEYIIISLEYQPTGDSVDVLAVQGTATAPTGEIHINVTKAQSKRLAIGMVLKVKVTLP